MTLLFKANYGGQEFEIKIPFPKTSELKQKYQNGNLVWSYPKEKIERALGFTVQGCFFEEVENNYYLTVVVEEEISFTAPVSYLGLPRTFMSPAI